MTIETTTILVIVGYGLGLTCGVLLHWLWGTLSVPNDKEDDHNDFDTL